MKQICSTQQRNKQKGYGLRLSLLFRLSLPREDFSLSLESAELVRFATRLLDFFSFSLLSFDLTELPRGLPVLLLLFSDLDSALASAAAAPASTSGQMSGNCSMIVLTIFVMAGLMSAVCTVSRSGRIRLGAKTTARFLASILVTALLSWSSLRKEKRKWIRRRFSSGMPHMSSTSCWRKVSSSNFCSLSVWRRTSSSKVLNGKSGSGNSR
mmetsp:Transcript_12500/g.50047  ORF Transcript_12500/g.50047 Transcript_12500/m.50047 type:complete len:211 (-) Transcript_12500:1893-2525(-)